MKLTLLTLLGVTTVALATPTGMTLAMYGGQPATYGGQGGNNGGSMTGGNGGSNEGGVTGGNGSNNGGGMTGGSGNEGGNNGGSNGGNGGQSTGPLCAGSGTPLCCATDVLGVAALTCSDPTAMPSSQEEFLSTCAKDGRSAQCCTLSAGSLALLCTAVA